MDTTNGKNVLRRQKRNGFDECPGNHDAYTRHHHHHHPAFYEDHFRICSRYRTRDWYPPKYLSNDRVPSGYVTSPRVPIGYYFNEHDIIQTTPNTCPFGCPRSVYRPDNINDTPTKINTKSKSKSTKSILDNCEIISGYIVTAYASDGRTPREFVTTQDCSDIGSQVSVDIINATGGVIDASKKLSAYMMPLTPEDTANDENPLVLVAHADEVAITLDRDKIMYCFNHDPGTEGDLLPSVVSLKKKIDEFREKKTLEKARGVKPDSGTRAEKERKIDTKIPISFMTSGTALIEDESKKKIVNNSNNITVKCVNKNDSPRIQYRYNRFCKEDFSVGFPEDDLKRSSSSKKPEKMILEEGNIYDCSSDDNSMITNHVLTDDESSMTLESEIEHYLSLDKLIMEQSRDYDIDSSSDGEDTNKRPLKPDVITSGINIPKNYKDAVSNKILHMDTDDSSSGMIPVTTKLRNVPIMRGANTGLVKADVDTLESVIPKVYKDAVSNKILCMDIDTDDSLTGMIQETKELRNVPMREANTGLLKPVVDSSGLNILNEFTPEKDHFTGTQDLDVDTASTGMNPGSTHSIEIISTVEDTTGIQEKDVDTSSRSSELNQGSTLKKDVTSGDMRTTGILEEEVNNNDIRLTDITAVSPSSLEDFISNNNGDFNWTKKNAFDSDCVPRDRFSLGSVTSQSTGGSTVGSPCFHDSTSYVSKGAIPKTSVKKGNRGHSRRKCKTLNENQVDSRSKMDNLSILKEDVRRQTRIVEKLMKEEEKQTEKLKYLLKKEQEQADRQKESELELEATKLITQYFQNPSPLSSKIHDFCKTNYNLFKDTLDDAINMAKTNPEAVWQMHDKLNKVIADDVCTKLEGLTFDATSEEDSEEERTSTSMELLACERMEELPKDVYTLVEVRLEEAEYLWVTKVSSIKLQHDIIDSCRQHYVDGLEECDITEGNFCLVGMGNKWVRGQIVKECQPPNTEVFLIDICMGGKISSNMSIKAIPQALTRIPSLGIRIKIDPRSLSNYGSVSVRDQIYVRPVGVVTGYSEDYVVVEVMSKVIHDHQKRYDQCRYEIPTARVAALDKEVIEDRVRTDNIKKKRGGNGSGKLLGKNVCI